MKKPDSKFTTLRFVFIAIVLMLLADTYLFGGKRSYIEEAKQSYREEQAGRVVEDVDPRLRGDALDGEHPHSLSSRPERSGVEGSQEGAGAGDPSRSLRMTDEEGTAVEEPVVEEPELGAILPEVVQPGPFKGKAKVAIIIDDLGMDVKRSRQIVDLPAPITLAFLPYGTKTVELAKIGKERGHELIIHTPMQALDTHQNIGPMGLKANMDPATFDSSFQEILQSFDGYDGINNHMGSLLTQDETAMARLMAHLKQHNLFFVDSRTINSSVAAREAREAGVPFAVRDVFLDHENTRAFVDRALAQLERQALREGSAIAIGHPKDVTIAGLKAWLPTLAAKGIEVVPVKELLVRPVTASAKADVVAYPRRVSGLGPQHGDDGSTISSRPEALPPLSSRPERSGVEGSQDTGEFKDPSASLGMTKGESGIAEGNDGITERIVPQGEILPEVLNAFEDAIAQPVQPSQPETLPAIY